jgi:hypothetical protein
MDSKELFNGFLSYFSLEEIVREDVLIQYGRNTNLLLSRFDPRLLETMLFIRERLGPITINNYAWGGNLDERGLRDNDAPMVRGKGRPYLSAHTLGAAFDFDVEGMTANEVRQWLKDHADELPYKIRLERKYNGSYISWVHLDVCDEPDNPKVYEFDV